MTSMARDFVQVDSAKAMELITKIEFLGNEIKVLGYEASESFHSQYDIESAILRRKLQKYRRVGVLIGIAGILALFLPDFAGVPMALFLGGGASILALGFLWAQTRIESELRAGEFTGYQSNSVGMSAL